MDRATRTVGRAYYEPTVGIREGASRFIDWNRANDDWYNPLVRQS